MTLLFDVGQGPLAGIGGNWSDPASAGAGPSFSPGLPFPDLKVGPTS